MAVGGLVLPSLIAAAQVAETFPTSPDRGAFSARCVEGLDAWWPRIAGRDIVSRGCAPADHVPEPARGLVAEVSGFDVGEGAEATMTIWRHCKPASGANLVLAETAAERVLAAWTQGRGVREKNLVPWRSAALPMVPADEPAADDPGPVGAQAALAALWAHRPGALAVADDAAGDIAW